MNCTNHIHSIFPIDCLYMQLLLKILLKKLYLDQINLEAVLKLVRPAETRPCKTSAATRDRGRATVS
jgi:hypothetical protein